MNRLVRFLFSLCIAIMGVFGLMRPLTVEEAIARAERGPRKPLPPLTFSNVLLEVSGLPSSGWWHNLTTDTATGYTNRRDWQSKALGGGFAPFATATGAATASGATSLTNSGASFPTAGQGLAGCVVFVGPNSSGTGSTVFGLITTNSGTVLTVDKWYAGGTWATGTTPNATGNYLVMPGQLAAMWLAITSDATAPSSADTTLASEATTNGYGRTLATYGHSAAASTFTEQAVYNATGSLTPAKMCLSASAVASTGAMPFETAIGSPPVMISGDQMTLTETVTI